MRKPREFKELEERLSAIDYKTRYINKVYVQLQHYGLNGNDANKLSNDKVFLDLLESKPDDVMYESPSFWAKLLMQRYNMDCQTKTTIFG